MLEPENELRKAIQEILSSVPIAGTFEHKFQRKAGGLKIYRTSLSSGLGSVRFTSQYHTAFKKPPPEWVAELHPYHQLALCRCSIDAGLPLPAASPGPKASEAAAGTVRGQ